jgi:hypothetical protein
MEQLQVQIRLIGRTLPQAVSRVAVLRRLSTHFELATALQFLRSQQITY